MLIVRVPLPGIITANFTYIDSCPMSMNSPSGLVRTFQGAYRFIDGLNEGIGRAISWLTLFMVLTTFTVVVLRYVFNMGSIAMQESISYMHGLTFMLGAAYTLKHGGHVRVDIFYREMSARSKALVDLFGTLFLLIPTFVFIALSSYDYVLSAWTVLEASPEAGGIPLVYLLKTAIPIMAILMLMQGLSMILRSMLVLMGVNVDPDTSDAEVI